MKKFLCFVLAVSVLMSAFSVALADDGGIDFSGLTFNQLLWLNQLVIIEITSREEWKNVTVPAGLYQVGLDIPAGRWTVSPANKGHATLKIGSKLDEAETDIKNWCGFENIADGNGPFKDVYGVRSVTWLFIEGYFFSCDFDVIFTTPVRESLSF